MSESLNVAPWKRARVEVVVACREADGIEQHPDDAWIEVDGVRLQGVHLIAVSRHFDTDKGPFTTLKVYWPVRTVRVPATP